MFLIVQVLKPWDNALKVGIQITRRVNHLPGLLLIKKMFEMIFAWKKKQFGGCNLLCPLASNANAGR